jgi:hypothetical protein
VILCRQNQDLNALLPARTRSTRFNSIELLVLSWFLARNGTFRSTPWKYYHHPDPLVVFVQTVRLSFIH